MRCDDADRLCKEAARCLHETEARLREAVKDAERYRWLRMKYAKGEETYFAEDCSNTEAGIDAEIDNKAMLAAAPNRKKWAKVDGR